MFDYTDSEGQPLLSPDDGSIATHKDLDSAYRVRRDQFEAPDGTRHDNFFVFVALEDAEAETAIKVVEDQKEAAKKYNEAHSAT